MSIFLTAFEKPNRVRLGSRDNGKQVSRLRRQYANLVKSSPCVKTNVVQIRLSKAPSDTMRRRETPVS